MGRISKVLVANRSEIAVRIIRAARDVGIQTVAVYSDQDRDALFTRLADEAFALEGTTPAETYLDRGKVLAAAARAGADAIHPGYGFLAENADFARAVQQAGLTWIGPPPDAIDALGDKVTARHIAARVGAPMTPGTKEPVSGAAEVIAFAEEHGLPVAIKAAYGGGGRGLKVVHTLAKIPEMFAAATREAIGAFGRGECFVERFLERPRHVETQCLADVEGNVVVVSTRDCSLQRRHQKLVEEAPAPFLTKEQETELVESSKAILKEAGYVGAGTCEFLVANDDAISFLEVNTRLQVEHPVSEEVTGIDLVAEQFRLAEGGLLDYEDPVTRGHSIEFRINAEDPGLDFMPAPGLLEQWQPPTGPGVRVDEGYLAGMTVPAEFDSLVAKLIVTGADRNQALARARRAFSEMRISGMPTVVPFHQAVLDDSDFTATEGHFGVHTRWIEEEFDNQIPPADAGADAAPEVPRETITVEVDGRRLEVKLPATLAAAPRSNSAQSPRSSKFAGIATTAAATSASSRDLVAPMPCTVVAMLVAEGEAVEVGAPIIAVEAMKMEQTITAHHAGVVRNLSVEVGQTLSRGDLMCEIADE